jgi:hypothetical protein
MDWFRVWGKNGKKLSKLYSAVSFVFVNEHIKTIFILLNDTHVRKNTDQTHMSGG